MKEEKKQVVAITGGCGRIGSSLAKDLLASGHTVLLGDINKDKLKKLKRKLNSSNIEIFSGDLTTKKNIDNFINFGVKKYGKISSVVCCSYPTSKYWGSKFEDLKENFLKEDLYKQLGATIILCQRMIKYFLKKKEGNLILISSVQGVQPPKFEHYDNLKMSSPIEYSAIKSGIIAVSRYLAKYYKNKNIKINCISPGGIKDKQPELFVQRYKKSCNSKGLLEGKDIAKLIMFLLSEKSKYITGQNLVIDDGWTL